MSTERLTIHIDFAEEQGMFKPIIDVAIAIGWLCRENNINIQRKGHLLYVSHLGF